MPRRRTFHVGEFAKITGVNKRTLHFYDNCGIFKPNSIEPNGYRSYSYWQVYPFYLIRMLRSMGLDLKEIKTYMGKRSPQELTALLTAQEDWLDGEIRRLQHMKSIVRNQRQRAEDAGRCQIGTVVEEDWPEARLFLSKPVAAFIERGELSRIDDCFVEHIRYAMDKKIYTGYNYGYMLEPDAYMTPGKDDVFQFFFIPTDAPYNRLPKANRFRRPAGRYIVTYQLGDDEDTAASYSLLRTYLTAQQLKPQGYSYEESYIDEIAAPNKKDFVTRVAIRVLPKK